MTYGYVRVSTREQNEERQLIAMRQFGVDKIYMDKQSGKDFNRPEYRKLVRKIKFGDVLVVQSLDRFGRNYDEIIEQWKLITKEKQSDIVVLDMPLLDTRNDKNLTGRLIADIVLQLLAYVAQTEREFIRKRQAEGIAAAKERGVKFGRSCIPVPEQFSGYAKKVKDGEISARQAASILSVSINTFLRWYRKHGYELPKCTSNCELFQKCAELYRDGEISGRRAAVEIGVSDTYFRQWCQRNGYLRPPKPKKENKPKDSKKPLGKCKIACCKITSGSLCCCQCNMFEGCTKRCKNQPTRCGQYEEK